MTCESHTDLQDGLPQPLDEVEVSVTPEHALELADHFVEHVKTAKTDGLFVDAGDERP